MRLFVRPTLSYACLGLALAACGQDTTGTVKDTNSPADSAAVDSTADTSADTQTPGCPLGASCNDGDPCTEGDLCDAAGVCQGTPKVCDDGLACTRDRCVAGDCEHAELAGFCLEQGVCPATGAALPDNPCQVCQLLGGADTLVTLADGAGCSDGDQCTTGDSCQTGTCSPGAPRVCSSADVCVSARCDSQLGCVEEATTAACDDGDPCTVGDACVDKVCQSGSEPLGCDDGDPCTIDLCDPALGCVHDAESKCDDLDPCTQDSCQVDGTCVNASFIGPCDDRDPCTAGELCDAGGTCGGGVPRSCDDANTCTTDACIPGHGCLNLFRTEDCVGDTCGPALCDDGEACTIDDRCVAGACFGGKTASCEACTLEPTTEANKIVSLLVMADGNPGSGLDIDDDPTTCAPSTACGGGVDNELALLAAFVNPGIEASIEDGVVKWIVDLRLAKLDGTEFPIAIYDSGLVDRSCDFQAERCEYNIAPLSLDASCDPYFRFGNARIEDGRLTAGGTGELINMVLPLQGGSLLAVTIAAARTEGSVTVDADGHITEINGIIGGAIPKAQLIDAVESLDPSSFSLPGLTSEEAAALLDSLLTADIDLDGDGLPEAVSVAMRIQTIPASIARL